MQESYYIICSYKDSLDWPYVIDSNRSNEIFIDPDFLTKHVIILFVSTVASTLYTQQQVLGLITIQESYYIICSYKDSLDWPYVIDSNRNNEIFIDPDFLMKHVMILFVSTVASTLYTQQQVFVMLVMLTDC